MPLQLACNVEESLSARSEVEVRGLRVFLVVHDALTDQGRAHRCAWLRLTAVIKKTLDVLRARELDLTSRVSGWKVEKGTVGEFVLVTNHLIDNGIDRPDSGDPCPWHHRITPRQSCRVTQVVEDREHAQAR
ncbi:hypothetical protein MXEN_06388 [Mycobacterium xenopi RIVM700367]|nr:hypothetical protein MXEN_06388 [Mycobacterium xenopi RIVM700367]